MPPPAVEDLLHPRSWNNWSAWSREELCDGIRQSGNAKAFRPELTITTYCFPLRPR
jgi:hypothetical protein